MTTNTMPDPSAESIPDFPMERAAGCPLSPPPQLRRLQAEQPLMRVRLWDGSTPWVVTRYDVQRALLSDQRCSVDLTRPGFPYMNPAFRESASAAHRALLEYVAGQIDNKLAHPGDDLLSELAARVHDGDPTHQQAASMGLLLLGAGHETSANMIALSTVALLEHPDQLAIVRDTDDPKVLASAVDELLRYLTIIHLGNRRIALEDIEIGGQTIRAGEGIVIPSNTANWQADAFPEPDTLDVHRDARRHMAFGFGIHQCLGQPLARGDLTTTCPSAPHSRYRAEHHHPGHRHGLMTHHEGGGHIQPESHPSLKRDTSGATLNKSVALNVADWLNRCAIHAHPPSEEAR
ncbi:MULTISPECIES: cytochrome P450 [unclassified Streptomyces]|uniref:cytochrome P450 n=1 Tax=unclassified Streptomyces TaxID=2593676 RepID=UPI003369CCCC